MKKMIFVPALFATLMSFGQGKTSNLFGEVGMNFYSETFNQATYNNTGNTGFVGAVTYSYAPKQKLGIGATLQVSSLQDNDKRNLTTALLADLRYYFTFNKKNTIMPIAQAGFNFYKGNLGVPDENGSTVNMKTTNNGQYQGGIAYSYAVFENGGGPFISVKYFYSSYNITYSESFVPGPQNMHTSGIIVTVGYHL